MQLTPAAVYDLSQGLRILVVTLSHIVGDTLPLLVSKALLILDTPCCACVQVRGAPVIGHVVQTRTGTGCQQENKRNDGCDFHVKHHAWVG